MYDDFIEDICCPLGYDCLSMTGELPEDCPIYVECKEWASPWRIPCYSYNKPISVCHTIHVTEVNFDDILQPLISALFPEQALNNVVSELNKAGWGEPVPIPLKRKKMHTLENGQVISATFVDSYPVGRLEGGTNRSNNQLFASGFYPAVPLPYEGYEDGENGKKGMKVILSLPHYGWMRAQSIYDREGVAYDML